MQISARQSPRRHPLQHTTTTARYQRSTARAERNARRSGRTPSTTGRAWFTIICAVPRFQDTPIYRQSSAGSGRQSIQSPNSVNVKVGAALGRMPAGVTYTMSPSVVYMRPYRTQFDLQYPRRRRTPMGLRSLRQTVSYEKQSQKSSCCAHRFVTLPDSDPDLSFCRRQTVPLLGLPSRLHTARQQAYAREARTRNRLAREQLAGESVSVPDHHDQSS